MAGVARQGNYTDAFFPWFKTDCAFVVFPCVRFIKRLCKIQESLLYLFSLVSLSCYLPCHFITNLLGLILTPCDFQSLLCISFLLLGCDLLSPFSYLSNHVADDKENVETADEAAVKEVHKEAPIEDFLSSLSVIEKLVGLEYYKRKDRVDQEADTAESVKFEHSPVN